MKPKLKPFKAWCELASWGKAEAVHLGRRPDEFHPSWYVRVVVRDAREDKELLARLAQLAATERVATDIRLYRNGLKRENARLRRLLDKTRDALVGGKYGEACELIAEELERRDR